MNDFLSTLVDRALDRAPSLERRRPSLFERVPAARTLPRMQANPAELVDETEAVNDSGPRERRFAPQPDLSPHVDPLPESRGELRATAPPRQASAEQVAPAAPRERTLHIDQSGATTRVAETTEHRVEREIHEEHEVVLRRVSTPVFAEPPVTSGRRQFSSSSHIAEPEKKQSAPEAGLATRPAVRPVRLPAELAPARPLASVPSKPVRRREQALANTRREAVAAEPQPPTTVQVTIGRIEIRATSAPAASPASAVKQSGPRLKLDDYLRARSGGRA